MKGGGYMEKEIQWTDCVGCGEKFSYIPVEDHIPQYCGKVCEENHSIFKETLNGE